MAQNVTNELMLEVLKQIQERLARMESVLADHTRQFIRVREDINGLRGDDLRREAVQAKMDERLQRIENRLNLTDA